MKNHGYRQTSGIHDVGDNMLESFYSQFAHPTGWLGNLVGTIMALKNRERNTWTISLLEIQPNDEILEIGFGPGWAIQQAAKLTPNGHIHGIDLSQTMLDQAKKRNTSAIRNGQVTLQQGAEAPLPYADEKFNKIFSINSFQFWLKPMAGLNEVQRVLKPGGQIAITIQPMWAKTESEVQRVGEELKSQLVQAGFKKVRLESKQLKPITTVVGVGTK